MKENFEQALHVINNVVEESPKEKAVPGRIKSRLEKKDLQEMIPEEARIEVYELQKEKQDIMDWLHDKLEAIDNEEGVEGYEKSEAPHKIDENLEVTLPNGEKEKITLGEIVTDGDWGVSYALSPKISREIKKRFVIAEARRQIGKLLNKQIGITETHRDIPKWMDGGLKMHMEHLKSTYARILEENDSERSGLVAEKMLKTYFEKFQIDQKAPYSFQMADVSDDVERKIDFFIHKHTYTRGVGAEDTENEDIGIQFTINPTVRDKKLKQIERSKKEFGMKDVDDIVLVTIPLKNSTYLYRQWVEEGKKPGGPTKLWTKEVEEKVFRSVFEGFFDKKVIDEMWNQKNGVKQESL